MAPVLQNLQNMNSRRFSCGEEKTLLPNALEAWWTHGTLMSPHRDISENEVKSLSSPESAWVWDKRGCRAGAGGSPCVKGAEGGFNLFRIVEKEAPPSTWMVKTKRPLVFLSY